jgi:hypothetical protein
MWRDSRNGETRPESFPGNGGQSLSDGLVEGFQSARFEGAQAQVHLLEAELLE